MIAAPVDLELGLEALADLVVGPQFCVLLDREHAKQRTQIQIRYPAVAYIDEVETLGVYPACEIVVGSTEDSDTTVAGKLEHEIALQWTVNGDNSQVMRRELLRLIAASRVLMQPGTLQPYVGGRFRSARADYGLTLAKRETNSYEKTATLQVFWQAAGL